MSKSFLLVFLYSKCYSAVNIYVMISYDGLMFICEGKTVTNIELTMFNFLYFSYL